MSNEGRPGDELTAALLAPVHRLRQDYEAAMGRIERVVAMLARIEQAQGPAEPRAFPAASERAARPPADEPAPVSAGPATPPREPLGGQTRIDVRGDFSRLLDLQEQLSQLSGVARVTVTHLSNEGATLLVEMEPPAPPTNRS